MPIPPASPSRGVAATLHLKSDDRLAAGRARRGEGGRGRGWACVDTGRAALEIA